MQLPARIGKYELQEFLGGGMARVYRAVDTVIGRTVAVKILTEEGCANDEIKSRFLQEARLAGNVTHDNVINIYDFGEDAEGRPFMVMEFLKGEDLRHAITKGSTGDIRNRLRIALDIARALEHIHSQNIIHRDIKPDNVHVTTSGAIKLMDFGISKAQDSTRTTTGVVMGTPYYMAPEQVLGRNITPLVDVYAFGVLLFELMTGSRPIVGDTVERIFYQILQEPLNVEPMRQAGIPDPIVDLVLRCTEKDPAKRPQSFGEVGARIRAIIHDWDAPTRPLPSAQPAAPAVGRRKPWLIPAVLAGMVVVLAGVYYGIRATRPPVITTATISPTTQNPPKAELKPAIETPTGKMVLVPAGLFQFGKDKQTATLPAFYIDETEVTNEAYAQFCKAKNQPMPEAAAGERPMDPIVGVAFLQAQDFAKWAGKRLPAMLEWEKAARGTDGRLYPWGNEPGSPPPANVDNKKGVMQVGSNPEGASPYGALNMLGNVWEWVDESRTPSPQTLEGFRKIMNPPPSPTESWYVIRGGGFSEAIKDSYLWDFATVPARYRARNIGFRCAKTP